MEMSVVINQMIVIFLMLLVGLLCAKLGLMDGDFKKKLSFIVLNVAQVAAILGAAMSVETDIGAGRMFSIVGIVVVMQAILYGLSFVYNFILRVPKGDRGTYQFMSTLNNVAFMGFPIVSALLGAEALFYNSLFNIPFYVVSYSLGVVMIAGKGQGTFSAKTVLLCPPLLAAIAAAVIVLLRVPFPEPVVTAATTLGNMTTPGAMLIIGASLGQMSLKEVFGDWRAYVYAVIKLISGPLVVWLILGLFVDEPLILSLAVILAAMPSAMNATMMALQYGGNEKVASRGVFITTILSLVTIPLMVYLLI